MDIFKEAGFLKKIIPTMFQRVWLKCTYIPAGHVGGGTLLPRCPHPQGQEFKQGQSDPKSRKVTGWGPLFDNDRCITNVTVVCIHTFR
jgi:hypothetical protein